MRKALNLLSVFVFICAFATLTNAQATRTWVSGVGDDANPCSRTAPCKTFAGAISKTATAGEISVLDPGGFGAVTITKSITINGSHGAGYGSILSSTGVTGVIINNASAVVRLKSLDINGTNGTPGLDGIRISQALKVYIEDVKIDGFTNRGINDVRTTANGFLNITDTNVSSTGQSSIAVIPGVGGSVTATLDNVYAQGSGNAGYAQSGNVKGTIRNSVFTGNTSFGMFADGTSGQLNIENCVASHNGTGLSLTAPAVARIFRTLITNNSISITGPLQVSSDLSNTISGNTTNTTPTGPGITPS